MTSPIPRPRQLWHALLGVLLVGRWKTQEHGAAGGARAEHHAHACLPLLERGQCTILMPQAPQLTIVTSKPHQRCTQVHPLRWGGYGSGSPNAGLVPALDPNSRVNSLNP